MNEFRKIGERLRLIRTLLQKSQQDISSATGVRLSIINKAEQNKYLPGASQMPFLLAIGKRLLLNSRWLIRGDGSIFKSRFVFLLLSSETKKGLRFKKELILEAHVKSVVSYLVRSEEIINCIVLRSLDNCYFIFGSGQKDGGKYIVLKSDAFTCTIVSATVSGIIPEKGYIGFTMIDLEDLTPILKPHVARLVAIRDALEAFYVSAPSDDLISELGDSLHKFTLDFTIEIDKKPESSTDIEQRVKIQGMTWITNVLSCLQEDEILSPMALTLEDKVRRILEVVQEVNATPEDLEKALKIIIARTEKEMSSWEKGLRGILDEK